METDQPSDLQKSSYVLSISKRIIIVFLVGGGIVYYYYVSYW